MNRHTDAMKLRLEHLRAKIRKARFTAWLIPRQDEFQGEYVEPSAERLQWLTGFAGSWGTAVVTQKQAVLFVDGRYTVQARQQVDGKLYGFRHLTEEPVTAWIKQHLKTGDRFGFDPLLTTVTDAGKLADACKAVGAKLVAHSENLVDEIWLDRPGPSVSAISTHPEKYAGRSVQDKIADISATLSSQKAFATILCDPASVSWLLNIRGKDVPHTPIVCVFAILRAKGGVEIFIDAKKVPDTVSKHLQGHATLRKPKDFEKAVAALGRGGRGVLIDPAQTPEKLRLILAKAGARIVNGSDPCLLPKAQKNPVEIEGARRAHVRDGAAMVKFLHWLTSDGMKAGLNEHEVAEKLAAIRAEAPELVDLSFRTISAVGPNAALPHYSVDPATASMLEPNQVYLVDSGGQYRDGTTDITRTLFIGTPDADFRRHFTLVLKGMIQVAMLRFPEGTTGAHLDAHARAALWKAGLDYDHGTGHGIGSYLSVHEGPQRISKTSHVALKPGMIVSDEPGYYKLGSHGIRIENLLLITKPEAIEGGDRDMLGFETLTLCPIDRRLIEAKLLTREELDWLDTYHAHVWRTLRPYIDGPAATWLTSACAPIR
jgi:Xaa-Pro aminopeptidase